MTRVDSVMFSVVIATYQGAHRVSATLRSLEKQTFKDFEIIVIVDGSTDKTDQVIRDQELALDLKVIVQENKGRAGARNAGVLVSQASAILFFDDDVELPPTILEQYYQKYQSGLHIVVGAFYPVYKEGQEFFDYSAYLNQKWNTSVNNNTEGFMKYPYLTAANSLIMKQIFNDVGGFDEALRDAEDFDLAVRLFEKGYRIYFAPLIAVGHVVQHNFSQYSARLAQYKQAQLVLRSRNPYVDKFASQQASIKGLKKIIFWFFSFDFYISLIDLGLFKILPRKLRYKLYDIVLTSRMITYGKNE